MSQIVMLYMSYDNIIYQKRVGLLGQESKIEGNNGSISICSLHPNMELCFSQHTVDLKLQLELIFPARLISHEHIYSHAPDKIVSSFQHLQFWEGRAKLCESTPSGRTHRDSCSRSNKASAIKGLDGQVSLKPQALYSINYTRRALALIPAEVLSVLWLDWTYWRKQ